mmetsp:Transcript_23392/g.61436  ORF Transcript_23392/g.61436 Transcript_23392/m.61436 type:complete len:417 (-) Transcript_23392:298-1548(-)
MEPLPSKATPLRSVISCQKVRALATSGVWQLLTCLIHQFMASGASGLGRIFCQRTILLIVTGPTSSSCPKNFFTTSQCPTPTDASIMASSRERVPTFLKKIRPGTSGSGASRSSDDTSTGSTPGGRGRRSLTSPQSLASSFSAGNRRVQNSGYRMDAKGSAIGRNQFAGTAAAHGSVLSHVPSGSTGTPNLGNPVAATGATSSTTGTVPAQQATPSANIQGNAQGPAPAPSQHRPGSGIRDYNRVSSPWHLPSPMSDFSTASDRVNSSLPSGSESCGENALQYVNGQYYECRSASEDPSHSDHVRSNQASDSDLSTPRSAEARVEEPHHDKQLPQQLSEKDIKSLITPLGLPRRLDQSPGATAINFREAVGMNENGPVIPARPAVAGAGAGNSGMPSLSAGQFGQSAGRRKARGGP